MNWENCDFASDNEGEVKTSTSESTLYSKSVHEENERKKYIQLQKWQDPRLDELRKMYITKVTSFGEFLTTNKYKEIARSLLAEDCETFLFNFGEITPVKYTLDSQNFSTLFNDAKVIKKKILEEPNVDIEKATVFQMCYCEVLNEQANSIVPQFSIELFSFRDSKISKYRAAYGHSSAFDEFNHSFTASTKDKMLAKIKEVNYAWADQPDFEKLASLLHTSTEYKLWSWEDQRGVTMDKNDFVEKFKGLQENYSIKCVVPYDVYSEGQFIMGNYVFHLEGKNQLEGQKFVWLSTCIYTFDKYLNISKINQQGEFYAENEIEIPWEANSRESIKQRILEVYSNHGTIQQEWGLVSTNDFLFSVEFSRFSPKGLSSIDHVKGFNDYKKLTEIFKERQKNFQETKVVDLYVDHNDESYDVAFTIECLKGSVTKEGYKYSGVEMDFLCFKKFCIENGKAAKMFLFFCQIPEVIPSPFDDHTFTGLNIRQKENI